MSDPQDSLRIDKWLWAARFFKTRALAAEAVVGGKVHINGNRVKPSRPVSAGDELQITRGQEAFVVTVNGINKHRRPASEAQLLYTETEQSLEKRENDSLQRKLLAQMHPTPQQRPGKRDRRHIIRFTRKSRD